MSNHIVIEFSTENDAWTEDFDFEVARILRKLAVRAECGYLETDILINGSDGNKIGSFRIIESEA